MNELTFLSLLMAIIFTLLSLGEIFTGFEWSYRIVNGIALVWWWFVYRMAYKPFPRFVPQPLVDSVELEEMSKETYEESYKDSEFKV